MEYAYESTSVFQISLGVMFGIAALCLAILSFTVMIHKGKNRFAREMTEKETLFHDLVAKVRYGLATDEEIKACVPESSFAHFEKYLFETVSTLDPIDVSAQRRIANVSGFTDHVIRRIEKKKRWDRAVAVRVLTYLRDPDHAPILKDVLKNDEFKFCAFSAGAGLALIGDDASLRQVGERLWDVLDQHEEGLLTILTLYGDRIAPTVHQGLQAGRIADDALQVVVRFLGDVGYGPSMETIIEKLRENSDRVMIEACLEALRHIGDARVSDTVTPFLEHEDFTLRIQAVHTLAAAVGASALPSIEDKLSDDNWWVRHEAAKAISTLGPRGISRLETLASDGDDAAGIPARAVLAELRYNRIAPAGH